MKNIELGVRVDSGNAIKSFDKLSNEIKDFSKDVQTSAKKASSNVNNFGNEVTKGFGDISNALGLNSGIMGDVSEKFSKLKGIFTGASGSAATLAAGIASLTTALIAGTTASVAYANAQIKVAGALGKLNNITGVSTNTLGRLANIAKATGKDMDFVSDIVFDFQEKLGDARSGNETYAESFKALGVDITQSTDDALKQTITNLGNLDDKTQASFRGIEIFSEAYKDLGGAIDQFNKKPLFDDKMIKSSGDLQKSLANIDTTFATALNDALSPLSEALAEIAKNIPITEVEMWGKGLSSIMSIFLKLGMIGLSVVDGLVNGFTFLTDTAALAFTAISNVATQAWEGLKGSFDLVVNGIVTGISWVGEKFVDILGGLTSGVEGLWDKIPGGAPQWLSDMNEHLDDTKDLLSDITKQASDQLHNDLEGSAESITANQELHNTIYGNVLDEMAINQQMAAKRQQAMLSYIAGINQAKDATDDVVDATDDVVEVTTNLNNNLDINNKTIKGIVSASNEMTQNLLNSRDAAKELYQSFGNIGSKDTPMLKFDITPMKEYANEAVKLQQETDSKLIQLEIEYGEKHADLMDKGQELIKNGTREEIKANNTKIKSLDDAFKYQTKLIKQTSHLTEETLIQQSVYEEQQATYERMKTGMSNALLYMTDATKKANTEINLSNLEQQLTFMSQLEQGLITKQQYNELMVQQEQSTLSEQQRHRIESYQSALNTAMEFYNQVTNMVNSFFSLSQAKRQKDIDDEKKKGQDAIKNAKVSNKKKQEMQAALDKKLEEMQAEADRKKRASEIANVWVTVASSIVQMWAKFLSAFAGPQIGVGIGLAAAMSALLIGTAIAQTAAINQYENGGVAGGFQGATQGPDNQLAMVRRGEMILNARQQRNLFEGINNGTLGTSGELVVNRGDIIIQGNVSEEHLDAIRQVDDEFLFKLRDGIETLQSSGEISFA